MRANGKENYLFEAQLVWMNLQIFEEKIKRSPKNKSEWWEIWYWMNWKSCFEINTKTRSTHIFIDSELNLSNSETKTSATRKRTTTTNVWTFNTMKYDDLLLWIEILPSNEIERVRMKIMQPKTFFMINIQMHQFLSKNVAKDRLRSHMHTEENTERKKNHNE